MDFNQTQKLSGDLFGYKEHSLESELEKLFNESNILYSRVETRSGHPGQTGHILCGSTESDPDY